MRLDDKISIKKVVTTYNDKMDSVATGEWKDIGKCCITPNSSASKIKGSDGADYTYSYLVIMRKPKDSTLIPREGEIVHISKKDGTIDKDCKVVGFVTLRNWLKVWL